MPNLNTPAPNFDDVWRTIQELALAQKESQKEADRRMREADRRMKEADLRMSKTDKQIKALAKQLGEHGNRLGEFVQEMVRPAVVKLFQGRNLPVHQVLSNLVAYGDDRQSRMEIDLLVVDTGTVIAVECKSRLSCEDVDEHLLRLQGFKTCFPQYQPYTLLGGVAAMVLAEDVSRYAYRKGLFVLAQSGDAMEIRNETQFIPKSW
ncbi:DUF3782 domain-containing protein [Magnetovirga frankeli]|uniref:DUF3782 domain-containing protein n=1 Tax=Magnetovirga frankeli TaxID=947516 RepID=UPI001293E2C8|nr:DUF3782 domain-containing protein [gamma proteobacterium SS-5]